MSAKQVEEYTERAAYIGLGQFRLREEYPDKSTICLIKQMKIIYANGFTDEEKTRSKITNVVSYSLGLGKYLIDNNHPSKEGFHSVNKGFQRYQTRKYRATIRKDPLNSPPHDFCDLETW
jgi:hypothetical protein